MNLNKKKPLQSIDYNELRSFIMKRLNKDCPAADMKWSFFVAALASYRRASVLRPYPKLSTISHTSELSELTNSEYTYLLDIVARVPSFKEIKEQLKLELLDEEAVELIHWVISNNAYEITSCDKNIYAELAEKAQQTVTATAPSYVFKITYPCDSFEKRAEGKKQFHAYHGSRFDNFHSILCYGLQGSLNKNALFGDGTYLSSELSVSLNYCPLGQGWVKSEIGELLSCLAYCDIIEDPLVKYGTTSSSKKSTVKGCMGGQIPEKYFVVQNSEALRVRYVLLYGSAQIETDLAPVGQRVAVRRSVIVEFASARLIDLPTIIDSLGLGFRRTKRSLAELST